MNLEPSLEPGTTFADRYVIERQLGTGGMAAVWLAYDQTLERLCALKVLDPQTATPDARDRFHREARVTARIHSVCVVNLFDHGEWRGLSYIVMEYLDGEDLASRIAREGRLAPRQACEVIAQVARGLTHAHASGVIHRDIKPENIFLSFGDEGEVAKILDFGIATRVARPTPEEAQAGLFLGTPLYASPEQLRSPVLDWRTDLWSLAVVAFECVTGQPPFTGNSMDELCGRIATQELPRPSHYDAELPLALDEWITRALARDPEARFQSAKELSDSFTAAFGGARLTIPSLLPRAEMPSIPDDVMVRPVSAKPPRRALPRWLQPAVALLLLVFVAIGYQRAHADVVVTMAPALPAALVQPLPSASSAAASALASASPPSVLPSEAVAEASGAPHSPLAPGVADSDAPVAATSTSPAAVLPAAAHKARHAVSAKPKAAPVSSTVDTWRRDPGF